MNDKEITQPLPRYRETTPEEDAVPTPPPPPSPLTQDEISTPLPLTPPPQRGAPPAAPPPPRPSMGCGWRIITILALITSLVSLALSAALVYSLLSLRQTAVEGLDTAIAALDNLEGQGFHYEYHFSQTIPFEGDIPIKQEFVFPFKGEFPINTVVEVPIDAGVLGTIHVKVPINTTIPVDVEVPIKLDQTIHVSTEIPLNMTIPIDIQPGDPAIQALLDQVRAWLVRLRDSF